MFSYVVEPPAPSDRRRAYLLPISIAVHIVVVAAAIAVPMFAPAILPIPATTLMAFINREVVTPLPPPPAPVARAASEPAPAAVDVDPSAAPIEPPAAIGQETVGESTRGVIHSVEAADSLLRGDSFGAAVDVAPPASTPEPTTPIHVGSGVTAPRKIHDVLPVY